MSKKNEENIYDNKLIIPRSSGISKLKFNLNRNEPYLTKYDIIEEKYEKNNEYFGKIGKNSNGSKINIKYIIDGENGKSEYLSKFFGANSYADTIDSSKTINLNVPYVATGSIGKGVDNLVVTMNSSVNSEGTIITSTVTLSDVDNGEIDYIDLDKCMFVYSESNEEIGDNINDYTSKLAGLSNEITASGRVGNYYLHILVYDIYGISKEFISNSYIRINTVKKIYDFSYTGNVQSLELSKGQYKLECWGAEGRI